MDKTKQMRFSDSELSLIKNTFSDNEPLLKAIRKVFLQIDLSDSEEKMIDEISKNKSILELLRKTFLPEIDGDAPIHQVIDLWMTLEIKDKDVDTVYHSALAREKLITYLEETLRVLEGKRVKDCIDFDTLTDITKDPLSVYVNLIVRNTILAHTEMQLNQLSVLAGTKDETVEETKERLFKNSAK